MGISIGLLVVGSPASLAVSSEISLDIGSDIGLDTGLAVGLSPADAPLSVPLLSQMAQQAVPRQAVPRQAVPRQAVPQAVRAAGQAPYRLGAGDVLQMEIFNLPDYSREYQVAADGYLTLPLVGSILVDNITLETLRAEAATRYQRYIRQPVITFEMKEARPLQISIAGEVNRPGAYTVAMAEQPGGNGMTPPTLTQIIQLAEGITQSADVRQIEVIRNDPRSANDRLVATVNLWDLLTVGTSNADLTLQDGDAIRVPTATVINPSEATTLASARFSPDEMNVYVVGEVESPGLVEVPPNTPLNQALLASGSFNERARKVSVGLVRLNANGTVNRRDIEVDLAADINEDSNPLLQQNDTIVVNRSAGAAFADTAGNFLSPFNALVNLFRALGGN